MRIKKLYGDPVTACYLIFLEQVFYLGCQWLQQWMAFGGEVAPD